MSLYIIFSFVLLVSVTNANVDESCKAAFASTYSIDYNLCTSSLRTNPKSEAANIHDLALIATQLCINNATGTMAKINDLITKGNLSDQVKDAVTRCSNVFNGFIGTLNGAVDSFNKANYADAMSKIDTVREQAYSCDNDFWEGGDNNMLYKDENMMDGLSMLALFLIARVRGILL